MTSGALRSDRRVRSLDRAASRRVYWEGKAVALVAEEVRKEQVPEFPYRVASPEFFFLLQRIDRLDEKFTGLFTTLDAKLAGEIAAVRQEVREVRQEIREEFRDLREEVRGTQRSWRILEWTAIIGFLSILAAILLSRTL
jgi:hypothetical protein